MSSRRFAQCLYQLCAVRSIVTPDSSPCVNKWISFILFTEIKPRASHVASIATELHSQSFPFLLNLETVTELPSLNLPSALASQVAMFYRYALLHSKG